MIEEEYDQEEQRMTDQQIIPSQQSTFDHISIKTDTDYINSLSKLEKYQFIIIKQKNKILQGLISISLLFVALYLFIFKVRAQCVLDDPIKCLDNVIFVNIKLWILYLFVSSLCILTVMVLSFRKKNWNKLYGILAIITSIYCIFFHYGRKSLNYASIDFQNYQAVATFILLFFLILEISITIFVIIMKKIKTKSKKAFYILLLLLVLFCYLKISRVDEYCENWDKGLVNRIDYSEQYCKIEKPSYCWNIMMDGWMDLSRGKICDNPTEEDRTAAVQNFYKNYDNIKPEQGIKYLAWKNIQEFSDHTRVTEPELTKKMYQSSQPYDSIEEAKKDGREIIIDIENQEMILNVQRKEEVLKERKKIQNDQYLAKTNVVLFIDTVSRQQFLRKLPKSSEFLKKYAVFSDSEQEKEENNEVFEFFRFHSVDKYTYNNLYVMNFNQTSDTFQQREHKKYSQKKKVKSLLTQFQEAGYMVGYTSNGGALNYPIYSSKKYNNTYLYNFYEIANADHEFQFYDPNYFSYQSYWGFAKGINSVFRRCAYGKDTNYFMFNYGLQFLDEYKDEKKVLYLEFQDSHEFTSEVLQYMDDNMFNFFTELESKSYYKSEFMMTILADHGNHFMMNPINQGANHCGSMCSLFTNYIQERMLPAFFLMVSSDILNKFELKQTLQANQQPIFSMWEVRNTLLCSVYGLQEDYCQKSLFFEQEKGRDCTDIGMAVAKGKNGEDRNMEFCACHPKN